MNRTRYQNKVAKRARDFYKKNSRGKLIWACGAGKSRASVAIASELDAKSILVCAPSIQLVSQLLGDYRERFKDAKFLCVCSDSSVATHRDEAKMDPMELGIDVTTDPEDVASFLRKRGRKIVVTTYQSGESLCRGAESLVFDFGVFDESHRTAGSGALSRMMLDDANVRIKKRLFMTATERRYKGKSDEILCMSDKAMYGDDIDVVSFAKAVEYGWLCDYKILAITVTEQEIKDVIEQRKGVQVSEAEMSAIANEVASAIVLKKVMDKKKLKRAISFHSTVSAAKRFQSLINAAGEKAFHVNGEMSSKLRGSILQKFESSDRAVITNAQCLSEGVDIPSVDCVLFCDPKKSVVDIVQASGRAMRTSESKKYGYIVVPAIVSSDDREEIESKAYEAIISVIRAMGSVDERIIARICGSKSDRGKTPLLCDEDPIEIDFEFSLSDLSQKIREKMVSRTRGLVQFWPFEKAREWARSSGIRSRRAWVCASKPFGLPQRPFEAYFSCGWRDWSDFLGVKKIARRKSNGRNIVDFIAAREWARRSGAKSALEWKLLKKPEWIPSCPHLVYKNSGWSGLSDFLGLGSRPRPRKETAFDFQEAREWARKSGISNGNQWKCSENLIPIGISMYPEYYYRNKGWKGWPDFLGKT